MAYITTSQYGAKKIYVCIASAGPLAESSRQRYRILGILGLCLPAAVWICECAQEAIYTFNVRSHIATPFSGTTCHKLSNITPQTWCRDELLHHKRDVEMTDNAVAQTSCRSAYSVTDVPSQPSWVTRNEPGLPRKKQKGGRKAKIEKRKNTRTSRLNLAH